MKIVCLDGYTLNPGDNPWDGVEALGDFTVYDRTPTEEIVERALDAEVVLTNKTPLSRETLEKLPKLKFISLLATGYNVVDIAAAREMGITVSNVPTYGTDAVAQFVFAMLLNHCHKISDHSEAVKSGRWASNKDFCFWDTPLIELVGMKMGIVGFGRIGQRVGELARAMGMEVLAFDSYHGNPPSYEFQWKTIEEVFSEADVVSLHCPQTAENAEFVNADLLGRMKSSAYLINTARGGLINESDLAAALNEDLIAGAALDVVSVEPIKKENVMLTAKNITITPHIAWAALSARKRLMGTVVENVAGYQSGSPVNVVN